MTDASAAPAPEAESSIAERLLTPVVDVLDRIGNLVLLTGQTLAWLVRPPYRFGQALAAMEFIGVESIFIVGLTGTFSGMVLALQTTNSLRQFGAEGVVGSVVAVSLTREISPVFASLMVTARAGSAMAAELGNMRVTEQIDAIVTMGVSPVQYLLSPRLLASVVMVPLLTILYTCVGLAGAWLVAVQGLGVDPGVFLSNIEKYMVPKDFFMGEIKALVFGFLVCAISCNQGYNASGGARGVGIATTRAVVESAVAILIANYLITSLMTDL
ncbi:MAG TPA: ABC transporter permease [Polyangiaceae bacterium]|nr:ABC transporter permease [Polyangiaceae bacterium]